MTLENQSIFHSLHNLGKKKCPRSVDLHWYDVLNQKLKSSNKKSINFFQNFLFLVKHHVLSLI